MKDILKNKKVGRCHLYETQLIDGVCSTNLIPIDHTITIKFSFIILNITDNRN